MGLRCEKMDKKEKKMTKSQKRKKLIEILPLVWNSYQHMYDVRERNIQSNINFLLIITTFLPILCVTLYTTKEFSHMIILTPIFFQFLALLILLKSFFLKGSTIHWFELKKEELLKDIERDEFDIRLISELKSLENSTYVSMKAKGKLIKNSVYLIIFSLLSMLLSITFIILNGSYLLYVLSIIIFFVFAFLLFIYYPRQPIYNYDRDLERYFKLLKGWLENENNDENEN